MVSDGDGCVPNDDCDGASCYCCSSSNTCDVVGAFYNGVCIGWVYSDSEGYTTVPAMGNDGNYASYPSAGDLIDFKLYNSDYGTIIDIVPGSEVPGWENFAIEVIYGTSNANNAFESGCTDQLACNFNMDAIIDDGSCVYESGELTIDYEVTDNSVELFWEDPLGTAPFIYLLNNEEVQSPFVVSDLNWGELYTFIITTIDFNASSGDCSSVNSEISVQIGNEPLPEQVSGLIASSSDGRVVLDWNDADNYLDYYNIYVYDTNNTLLEIQSTNESYLIHDNLLPNFTYVYNVEAVNSQGFSGDLSDSIESTTLPLLEATIDDLSIGQGYIRLDWSIAEPDYNGDNYIFDIYQNGNMIYTSYYNTYLASDLSPGEEYCFTVVPKIHADYLGNNSTEYSIPSNESCGTPSEITSWSVLVSLNVEGWGDEVVSDISNELGMHSEATNFYDPVFDIFEPITSPTQWASFYFPHPDWYIELGDNFTSDFRLLTDLSSNLEVWDAEFISDVPGPAQLSFDFINLANAGDWPIYLKLQTTSDANIFDYYRLSDNAQIDFFYLPENQIRTAQIIVGNSMPGPPIGFEAVGGPRRMNLSWEERELCVFDELSCDDPDNRYAPTGYKIFRNSELHYLISLSNHEITFFIDQLYVNDNEEDISIAYDSDLGQVSVDCYEEYVDGNFNGQYDLGEAFIDCGLDGLCIGSELYVEPDLGESDNICNRFVQYTPSNNFVGEDSIIVSDSMNGEKEISLKVVNEMIYSHTDESLLGSNIYNYYMIAYNHAGDSPASLLSSDVTDPNVLPIADGGLDQVYYLYEEGLESVLALLPKNDDGSSNNYSYDPDAFENEYLVYSWEKLDGDDWVIISDQPSFEILLDISDHYFRHRVMDVTNMWSPYDYITVEVKGLPEPAQVENFNIESDLYYLELNWDRSYYTEDAMPEGYSGDGFLATYYEIYYEGEDEILAVVDDSSDPSNLFLIDNGLIPSNSDELSEYCYTIYAVNAQDLRSLPTTQCGSTGVRPSIDMISPNGAEIIVSETADYPVSWGLENGQYIDNIEIFFNSNFSADPNSWESIYYSNQISSGCLIDIPEVEGVTGDNKLKIVINDKGDYNGDNINSYSDESDYTFIIASNTLQYDLSSGINVIGAPMALDSSINLVEHLGGEDDNLGDFWLAFNELSESSLFNDFNLDLGQGYYLLNIDDGYFSVTGEVLSDAVEIHLNQGWNLISNPLVVDVLLNDLSVLHEDNLLSWSQATNDNPVLSPAVIGYNNIESTHFITDEMSSFHGYWIHSLYDNVSIVFESFPYEESDNNIVDTIDAKIMLIASESDSSNPLFSVNDFIIIGMDENAEEGFLYGEDLYDFPAVVASKFTNLFINHSQDWFTSNDLDQNGNVVESPRFMTDIRPFNAGEWRITGELLGTIGSSAQIRLDWIIDGDIDEDINLIINGRQPIDMTASGFVDDLSSEEFQDFIVQVGDVLSNEDFIVNDFNIENPYPNPFNPQTSLNINIPISDNVNISVYDISGNLVEVLHNGYLESGRHSIHWSANNQASGVYLFKTNYRSESVVKKAILIK